MVPTEKTLSVPDDTTDTPYTPYTLDTIVADDQDNDGEVEIYGLEPIHLQVYTCLFDSFIK